MEKKFKIAVVSGKGGVGKSMIASSLSILFSQDFRVLALDCDVDTPNLAIWLGEEGRWEKKIPISTSRKPVISSQGKCDNCQKCVKECPFGALFLERGKLKVNYFLCEGCGLCEKICPEGTIKMKVFQNGEIREKKTSYGFRLISGRLFPGESGSGRVVDEIKNYAENFSFEIMIIDSPPGTGCPVVSSLKGVDLSLLVIEPTPSGISDAKRVLKVISHFKIPYLVIGNKWGINPKIEEKVERNYKERFLGSVSYDKRIFEAISHLRPILKTNLPAKKEIKAIHKRILTRIKRAVK